MTKQDLVTMALNEYGTTEIVGGKHNVKIVDYFKEIGQGWVADDETAWCAAFLNAMLGRCQLPHSNSLAARSFLDIGLETESPEQGDVVVLWRVTKDSPYGHCGIFIAKDESWVYILGGNQSNAVNISKYPAYQVLGYRNLVIN